MMAAPGHGNLVSSGSFEADRAGKAQPHGCGTWAPWEAIAPTFAWDSDVARTGKRSLKIENAGKRSCYGRWEVTVPKLPQATHYRVIVHAKATGVEDISRSVAVELSWLGLGKGQI